MKLFKLDVEKPGPGVPKNAPRKKGIGRVFEILGRDMGNLFKLNLIYYVCVLPSISFLVLSIINFLYSNLPMMLLFGGLALAFSILVGPASVAMNYLITKMMRDEPGYIFYDFRQVFKKNFKVAAIPGMIYSLILGAQIFGMVYFYLFATTEEINFIFVSIFMLSLIIFWMASPYFFLQLGYLKIPTLSLVRNSLLLALGYLPRSFLGTLFGAGLLLVQLILFPYSSFFTIIGGYVLPAFLNMAWIWPVVNDLFKIEKTMKKRLDEQEFSGDASDDAPAFEPPTFPRVPSPGEVAIAEPQKAEDFAETPNEQKA